MRADDHSDVEKFDPSRHLTSDGQLKPEAKQSVVKYFGFGRRYVLGHWHDLGNTQQALPRTPFCGEFTVGGSSSDAFCTSIRQSQELHGKRY